jgi:hypothetical protein
MTAVSAGLPVAAGTGSAEVFDTTIFQCSMVTLPPRC